MSPKEIRMMDMDEGVGDNEQLCPCCRKPRPYPTKPGKWQYREVPRVRWNNCEVVEAKDLREVPDGEIVFVPEGADEPMWWPGSLTEWRER